MNPVESYFAAPLPDGYNVLYLGGAGTSMNQNLAETMQAGITYTLTGYVSNYLRYYFGENYAAGGTLQLLTQTGIVLAEDIYLADPPLRESLNFSPQRIPLILPMSETPCG